MREEGRARRRSMPRAVAATVSVAALTVTVLIGVLPHRPSPSHDAADSAAAAADRAMSRRPVVARVTSSAAAPEGSPGAAGSTGGAGSLGGATQPKPPGSLVDSPPGYPRGLDSFTLTGVPAGWAVSTTDLVSGGLSRSYLMIRPPAHSGVSLPVVMVLHGRGLTPASMERISQLLPVVGRAITVFPAGWQRSWNAGGCCGLAHAQGVADTVFLSSVVHQVLATQHDASARQVYLVGYSNGGRMAMRMACADPGMFAGLAAVEAVPVAPCASTIPLPVVMVASTGDPLLTIATNGPSKTMQGYLEPTVGETVDAWRQLDGCSAPSSSKLTGVVTSTAWTHCEGKGSVQYDLYQGGSHRWPVGGRATPSPQTLIADFLWGGATAST